MRRIMFLFCTVLFFSCNNDGNGDAGSADTTKEINVVENVNGNVPDTTGGGITPSNNDDDSANQE